MIAGAVTGKGEAVVEWTGWSLETAAGVMTVHFYNIKEVPYLSDQFSSYEN